jgi:predicted regulator of Ras-like GTPase activity (Roadblock/LC7/MglB family)
MDAAQALADLTEISSQIEAAVLAQADGSVVASTFREPSRGAELARAAVELVSTAGDARGDPAGRELVQMQAATPRGSVFVVRDERHVVAAIAGSKPTVGLVFYDLKMCLRMLEREEAKAESAPTADPPSKTAKEPTEKEKVGKASAARPRSTAKKKEADEGS